MYKKILTELGLDLPGWWVQSVIVEYLDCREYATRNEIWTFNFNLISKNDLIDALKNKKIVVSDPIIHNVSLNPSRLIRKIAGDFPSELYVDITDFVAEGHVSKYSSVFYSNPIYVWDPILSFSQYFQVYDEGRFWQHGHADFKVKVEDFYKELKSVRADILSQLWDIHLEKKDSVDFSKLKK